MAKTVWENETGAALSPLFENVSGKIQVDIAGVLDGADVITYSIDNFGNKAPINTCSWRTSLGQILTVADAGYQLLNRRNVQFEIKSPGASTDISLSFDSDETVWRQVIRFGDSKEVNLYVDGKLVSTTRYPCHAISWHAHHRKEKRPWSSSPFVVLKSTPEQEQDAALFSPMIDSYIRKELEELT